MAKIFTFVVLMVGLEILFAFAGISYNFGFIGKSLRNPSDWVNIIDTVPAIVKLFTLLNILAIGGVIVAGLYGRSVSTIPISATLATTVLVFFVSDMLGIINFVTEPVMKWFIVLLLGPIAFAYIIALWDWTRSLGSD